MKQDILHIRDVVSKTFTITDTQITVISDFDDDEIIVPTQYIGILTDMFEFAYTRADEFTENKNGVILNISGDTYDEQLGKKAQVIWESVRG